MFINLRNSFKLLLQDRVIQSSFFIVTSSTVLLFFIFGVLSSLAVLLAFVSGYVISKYIFDYRAEIISALSAAANTFRTNREKHAKPVKCNVCGDNDCSREKIVHKQQPWAGLMVPQDVDSAVESLLERTLNEFVTSWYKNVSVDGSFPAEVRYNVRYCASSFLSRAMKVRMGRMVTKRVLPAMLCHVEMCREVCRGRAPPRHPALFSRQAELDYLRHRITLLLPLLIDKPHIDCGMLSVLVVEVVAGWLLLPLASLSDPALLNSLMLLSLTGSSLPIRALSSSSAKVEFLQHFASSTSGLHINTALLPDMCTVMKDQTLLYAFMQFLKDQGAVHILQFCLDVEEFNRRMLSPELESEELDLLHRDAWDLYSVYFSPHSPDNIGFPSELVTLMRKVLSKDVSKLRTSPPLFQAYEHAYSLLDKTYCRLFHTSDEFYMWLCGPRTPKQPKSGSRSRKAGDGGVLRLGSRVQRLRGALRAQTVLDGQALEPTTPTLESGAEFGEELSEEEVERDMSNWKVSITSSDVRLDPTGKLEHSFTLAVSDGANSSWAIERRPADFYALEAKLTEFHGEFSDNRLPSAGGILSTGLPTHPQVYEEFLDKLLKTESLRGSDLVHWFLACPVDFALEEGGLGRLLRRSVAPLSLRKERGQNIEPFIAAYISSTETRTKSTKLEWKEHTYELSPRKKRCLTNTIFKNNLDLELSEYPKVTPGLNPVSLPIIRGPTDAFMYLGSEVLNFPRAVMRVSLALIELFRPQLDSLCSSYLEKKLYSYFSPHRTAHLINLLQWAVFDKQGRSDPREVRRALEQNISKLKGTWASFYLTLYQTLQDPMNNKQLFYTLLDILLDEVFPEKPKM